MLSNSVVAACLGTAYVLALVLHLNPIVPLHPARLESLVTTVGLFYAVHLTVISYMLLVLRQIFASEVFAPAWISVDVQTWLGSMTAGAGAALMWANVTTFGRVIDAGTADALRSSVAVLAGASALFVVLAAFRRRRPEARLVWAFLFVLIGVVFFSQQGAGRRVPRDQIRDAESDGDVGERLGEERGGDPRVHRDAWRVGDPDHVVAVALRRGGHPADERWRVGPEEEADLHGRVHRRHAPSCRGKVHALLPMILG